jgi:integrase
VLGLVFTSSKAPTARASLGFKLSRPAVSPTRPQPSWLSEVALLTGPRYGELIALRARDFDEPSANEIILRKADGTAWKKNDQFEPIRETCTAAKIAPRLTFHAIRHTTASLLVEKGVPLAFVAEMLGHTDTRMVSKHYAHLAKSITPHADGTVDLPTSIWRKTPGA